MTRLKPGERIVRALRALGGKATRGDLIMATGLPRAALEASLDSLMVADRVHVTVSETAVITYRLAAGNLPGDLTESRSADRRTPAEAAGGEHADEPPRRSWSLPRGFRPRLPRRSRPHPFDRKTLQLIRARGGVVSLAELVEHTGLTVHRARREAARLSALYGGEPHPSWDDHVVYAFPDLVESAHGDFHVREPRPAWARADAPMEGRTVVGAILGRLIRHPRLRLHRASTLRRYVLGYVFETALRGKGVVSLHRTVSFLRTRTGSRWIRAGKVESVLRGLAAEFDAPVTELDGDLFFGFRNVKRQFLASHVQRIELALERHAAGRTVFHSGDSELAAAQRELEEFDRALHDEPPATQRVGQAGPDERAPGGASSTRRFPRL